MADAKLNPCCMYSNALNFIMEANIMNPDQMAPKLIWVCIAVVFV